MTAASNSPSQPQPGFRVAVTGSKGLFGQALERAFRQRHETLGLSRAEADLTDAAKTRSLLLELRPRLIVHAAAERDPDRCERDPQMAWAVNAEATRNLVETARLLEAPFVFISSDAVFAGTRRSPYREEGPTDGASVYAQTKIAAEQFVRTLSRYWIFRISVLFGPGRTNFVEKVLLSLANGQVFQVPSDQIASATYTVDAAATVTDVIAQGPPGLYHLSNSGSCGREELARTAAQLCGLDPSLIHPVPSEELHRPAPRPKYAVMEMASLSRAGFRLPRHWHEALKEYCQRRVPLQFGSDSSHEKDRP